MLAARGLLVCALGATLSASVIPLWPSSSIEMHPAPAEISNHVAVILTAESPSMVEWLNRQGFCVFVLSRAEGPPGDAADIQRAIRLVRVNARFFRAAEWSIDPQRIGVIGFEFGEAAARAAISFDAGASNAFSAIDQQSDRPDFAVLDSAGWNAVAAAKSRTSQNVPPAFLAEDGDGEAADGWHARFVEWITALARDPCCGFLVEAAHGECLCH